MSERFIIEGLGGVRALSGSIEVRGAKNAALKALAASVLFDDGIRLHNVPDIEDVRRMNKILKTLGISMVEGRRGERVFAVPQTIKTNLPMDLAQKMRASIVLSGPILGRFGSVSFPHPGGCVIGKRPIDLFIDGFIKMGAQHSSQKGLHTFSVPGKKLSGAVIVLKKPSVTATETLMMAGVLARGETVLKNAAQEPEIAILADFLNQCGARISGAGTSTITIRGVKILHSGRATYTTPPDRIEAGSFLLLGALSARELEIKNCIPSHLETPIEILRSAGVPVETGADFVVVRNETEARFQPADIKTSEYPGFPTDLQAPMTVFLTQALGRSHVFETIFEGRLAYVPDLVRMGARIDICDPHRIIVYGPAALSGREVESPDLRAGLAFVIAAVVADGKSVIHNVCNIDRGYEKIEERLQKVGVDIRRISN